MLGNSFHLISAVIAEMDETMLEEKLAFKIYASLQSQIAAFFFFFVLDGKNCFWKIDVFQQTFVLVKMC